MQRDLLDLLVARRGHFRLESGDHGDLWLDLDALLERPGRLVPQIEALGDRLSAHRIDAVCGPLTGGAFLAFAIAARLDLPFAPAERSTEHGAARYRIPAALRSRLAGRSFAVVDDVINAGSAVAATCAELRACGAEVRVLGALAVLGTRAQRLGLPIEATAEIPNALWSAAECPQCASGVALDDLVPG
jgi:orotate phosphoribosyltransferase